MQWRASSNPQKIAQAAHSLVLSGLAKQGNILLLQSLLEKMREHGPKPNVITYNTALDGMRRAHKHNLMVEYAFVA
jgi:pentatricopeptide repeat protein